MNLTEHRKKVLETKALVLGYAMSRLDTQYLEQTGHKTWVMAFRVAADALKLPSNTLKNLRDEFDPLHDNKRVGWHRRPLRSSRLRIARDLENVSDDALAEPARRILGQDDDSTAEAISSLANPTPVAAAVAARLLTGRLAEEFIIRNFELVFGVSQKELIDCRLSAQGFDFGISTRPEVAVEVKGIRLVQGEVLFTDREWKQDRGETTIGWRSCGIWTANHSRKSFLTPLRQSRRDASIRNR